MKNLKTTITKETEQTTTITKSFESKTPNGLKIIISIWRSIIDVTEKPHETKNYYSVSYNGNESIGYHKMDRDGLNYYIGFIDKWAHKL
jgi:hypothetical protein